MFLRLVRNLQKIWNYSLTKKELLRRNRKMKFCKIQDTLNRCSSFLDVACIALDNEHFFPEGNTISLLLEDVNNRINTCVEELEKMKGNNKK